MAFKATEDFGCYRGRAEATLKLLQDTMEYVSDDYYDLLVSPDSLDDQAGQGKERKRKVTKRK